MNTAPVDWMSDIRVFDAVDCESIGLKNFRHNVENLRLGLHLQRGKQIQLDLRLNFFKSTGENVAWWCFPPLKVV